jgi:aminoglycoside 3-N-acetyltransferase
MLTQVDIERGLRDLGLDTSSHALVHSSYKSLGGADGGPATVVRALVESFATLMMPAFTSDRTFVWDPRGVFEGNAYAPESPATRDYPAEPYTARTPANRTMGVINETFRTSYAVRRSLHPSASFVTYGAIAERLVGPGTELDGLEPIRRLMDAGGDVLLLGVTHTNSTAVHLAEQLAGRQLFVRYCLTPTGVVAARGGGCGDAFDQLQPYVEHFERRVTLGTATLRCYALQPYVAAAIDLIARDPLALLCRKCARCRAHTSRVAAA